MLRPFQNRMSADPSEKTGVAINMKCHPVSLSNPCLPDGFMSFHFLNTKRGMMGILHKVSYLFVYEFLNLFGKGMIVSLERFRERNFHFFRAFMTSEALENGPSTLPSSIAFSASCSFSCHSLVQNHSWSLGTSFLGTRTMVLSLIWVSRKSPLPD